ncbi:MAG: hypothetical protein FWF80_00620 [Defluviitaleaceae bacterium]|nr:hypothetical protein [Defluviitaleaceae bacterium]
MNLLLLGFLKNFCGAFFACGKFRFKKINRLVVSGIFFGSAPDEQFVNGDFGNATLAEARFRVEFKADAFSLRRKIVFPLRERPRKFLAFNSPESEDAPGGGLNINAKAI